VRNRVASLLAAVVIAPLFVASAQRQTGVIGQYTPPRVWKQEPRRFDLVHQKIEMRFDVPHRELFATVTTRLVITLAPTDTIFLNAENLTIDGAADDHGRTLRFTQDTAHVTVRLAHRAAIGDTVQFALTYHTVPERGLYIVPRKNIVWSQGEATETRAWIPTYDASNDKTTWEFLVTADSGLKVLSNGKLVGVTPANGGKQNVWHWVQEKPASTYLYSVVVGPFTVLKDQWRGIPVEYWTYADTVNAAWRSFGETPSMIELYSQVLGINFAWDKYDQSIIPDFTYGGMENVSATTQTDLALHPVSQEPENSSRGLVAHELAHQWFGDLTTTADWADIWVNEGITTYMESVQDEKSRGWDDAELNWYQQQQAAMQADQNEVRSLVWGKYQGNDPIALFFSGHVYPKGAQLAHQLRHLLGDQVFWAGMHRFLSDNAYQPVTTADYAVAMEKTCNCDLDWFFDQWAYGIGWPKVEFRRHWAANLKTLHLIVSQTQPIDSLHPVFQFPATVRVITRDSVIRQQVFIHHQTDTFAIALPSEPLSFRFDEGGWLLGTVKGDLSVAELADEAKHDLDIRGRRWAIGELEGNADPVAVETRRFVALNDHTEWLREVATRMMARDSNPETRAVVVAALRDPEPQVRNQALQTLTSLDSAQGLTAATALYTTDPNDDVRNTALAVIAARRGKDALPLLLAAVGPEQTANRRFTAMNFLAHIRDPQSEDALERTTATVEDRFIRQSALQSLATTGDSARATALALKLIPDYDPLFAVTAVQVVGQVGGDAGKARLRDAMKKETRVFVKAAMEKALAPAAASKMD